MPGAHFFWFCPCERCRPCSWPLPCACALGSAFVRFLPDSRPVALGRSLPAGFILAIQAPLDWTNQCWEERSSTRVRLQAIHPSDTPHFVATLRSVDPAGSRSAVDPKLPSKPSGPPSRTPACRARDHASAATPPCAQTRRRSTRAILRCSRPGLRQNGRNRRAALPVPLVVCRVEAMPALSRGALHA